MVTRIGKVAVAAVAAAGLAMSIPAGSASAATVRSDINSVPCNNGGFLQVWWHPSGGYTDEYESCFANAGTVGFDCNAQCWLDSLSTGNNEVQYESNGRWQPATPVAKYTYYTFPHFPGGVSLENIRIL